MWLVPPFNFKFQLLWAAQVPQLGAIYHSEVPQMKDGKLGANDKT